MKNRKGFTLVELLAVMAILGILVIIVLPNVVDQFKASKKNTFITEIRNIYSVAKRQWVKDSTKGIYERTYGYCDGCSYDQLDLTGRKELQYRITISQEGNVTYFEANDGTFQYKYVGSDLQLNEINDVTPIAGLPGNEIITITDDYFDDQFLLLCSK